VKSLSHLRDSVDSDPGSLLQYWVSKVYDDKNFGLTMCDRVLILPSAELLQVNSCKGSEPISKTNLVLRSTRPPQVNDAPCGAECEVRIREPTSPRVIEK